jgi:hypothetical protein
MEENRLLIKDAKKCANVVNALKNFYLNIDLINIK